MELDDGVKLILLPKGYSSFDVISLSLGDSRKKLLATSDQLYELREVYGSSDFDVPAQPQLPSGGAVKSIILESKDSSKGWVLKTPSITTCTPFNIAYYVLNAMYEQPGFYTSRFHTFDDIVDNLFLTSCHPTLASKIRLCMDLLCSTIEENGDEYFKLLLLKSFDFISEKVGRLKSLIKISPNFILAGNIAASLCSPSDTPAPELVDLQTTKYCIDMIFGSYLSEKLKMKYLEHFHIDLSPLDTYLKEIESRNRAMAAIEENMESVVLVTKKANTKKSTKVGLATKKPVKKVAVGKGALDGFFRKA